MRHVYAKIETNFLHDPRMLAMPIGQRYVYLAIWLAAVEYRTATLTRPMSDPKWISRRAGARLSVTRACIESCLSATPPLLERDTSGRLTVCGVTKIHSSLFRQRQDTPYNSTVHNSTVHESGQVKAEAQDNGTNSETSQLVVRLVGDWEKLAGRPATLRERAVVSDLEGEFGHGLLSWAFEQYRKYRKPGSKATIAYVRKVCQNNAGKANRFQSAKTIGDILKIGGGS
jgi:hypothetical protein